MAFLDLKTAFVLIIGLLNIILAIMVLGRTNKDKVSKSFGAMALLVGLWSIIAFGFRAIPMGEIAYLLGLALYVVAAFLPTSFLVMALIFPPFSLLKKKIFIFLLLQTALVSVLTLIPNFVITDLTTQNGEKVLNWGNYYFVYVLHQIILFSAGYVVLIKKFFQAQGLQKTQLKYVILGTILPANLALATNLILPWLGIYEFYTWLGQVFMILIVFFSGYAIFKHQLFNIKVIATEIFVFAISVVLLVRFFLATDFFERVVSGLIFLSVLLFGFLLVKSVWNEVSQKEELQKLAGKLRQTNADLLIRNRYLSAFQSLTNEITRSLDYKKVTQSIVDSFSQKLGFVGGMLLMLDKSGDTLRVEAITQNPTIKRALKMLPRSVFEYRGDFKNDQDLSSLAIRTGRTQIGTDLYKFIGSPVPKGTIKIIQNLLRIRTILAVPIMVEDKPVGCLLVAIRRPKAEVSETEIQMIKALADEVGIVTRNLHLYEALEKANNKLKNANQELAKLDLAKTEFLSVASHQLRTPLTAIKGYASMVLEGDYGKLPDKMKAPVIDIHESAERLINLVNDLLDVSRIASGRLELHITSVDLVETTKDIIKELKPKAEDKNTKILIKQLHQSNCFVKADADKLRQVIVNLIDNGIKYSENGQVLINIEEQGSEKIRFTVEDTGIGLTSEELKSLFQRFVRTKEAQLVQTEGTGLGLYVAKNIIDALGGKIWAESEGLNKGSRFIFELPKASASDVKAETVRVVARHDHIV